MKIFQYKDYEDYIQAQIAGNLQKIDKIKRSGDSYVKPNVIKSIVEIQPDAKRVLCHGTRNANEQKYFLDLLPEAFIIGSEVSTNAEEFPMTVQQDFNKVREEWVGSFDIVYSNSFDHSITPLETLCVWRDQLNSTGMLFLEHTVAAKNHVSTRIDPLKIEKAELQDMIGRAGMTIVQELKGTGSGYVLVCKKL